MNYRRHKTKWPLTSGKQQQTKTKKEQNTNAIYYFGDFNQMNKQKGHRGVTADDADAVQCAAALASLRRRTPVDGAA